MRLYRTHRVFFLSFFFWEKKTKNKNFRKNSKSELLYRMDWSVTSRENAPHPASVQNLSFTFLAVHFCSKTNNTKRLPGWKYIIVALQTVRTGTKLEVRRSVNPGSRTLVLFLFLAPSWSVVCYLGATLSHACILERCTWFGGAYVLSSGFEFLYGAVVPGNGPSALWNSILGIHPCFSQVRKKL